jgi:hypothetical protein
MLGFINMFGDIVVWSARHGVSVLRIKSVLATLVSERVANAVAPNHTLRFKFKQNVL